MGEARGVQVDNGYISINGKRVFLFCGEVHYFRVPKGLWLDRLLKVKRAGLNCVASYIAWNWHEPVESITLFSDEVPEAPYESNAFSRDVEGYIQLAKQLGLYFIARPGPYICSEWDGGGHPNWLYTKNVVLRSLNEEYMRFVEEWYSKILPIIARNTVPNGGSVALLQIENEYFWGDAPYLMKLYEIARKYVKDIPIITNEDWFVEGTPIINTIDDYPSPWSIQWFDDKVKRYMRTQPGMLKMFMELEGGWFSTFGGPLPTNRGSFPAEWTETLIKTAIGLGINGISIYMFHGGTNPGYYTGKYITTTYDYDASIREWGELSPRYYTIKRVALFTKTFNDLVTRTRPAEDAVKATTKGIDVFTRVADDGAAIVVLRNLGEWPQQTKVVYNGVVYPFYTGIRVPGRNAKIILLNYRIEGTPFRIVYTSSEPLMLVRRGNEAVLIVYGDVFEVGEIAVEAPETSIEYLAGVNVVEKGKDRVVLSYMHNNEDKLAAIASNGSRLYIVAVSRERASRTWYIDELPEPIVLVSNIYFVGKAETIANTTTLQLELDENSCGNVVLISFKPLTSIDIGGEHIKLEHLVGPIYRFYLGKCYRGEVGAKISVGDLWRVAEEPLPQVGVSIEPKTPLERAGMMFNGYAIYTIEFNLSEDLYKSLDNKVIYISYFNDFATARLNNVSLDSGYHSIEADASKALRPGRNVLEVVLESTGHTNDGIIYAPNGIVGDIYIGKVGEIQLTGWRYIKFDLPVGPSFSLPQFLQNPKEVLALLQEPKVLEKSVETTAIDLGGGVYIKNLKIQKNGYRYILDLGKTIYSNYYPRALVFVNKRFVGVYKGPMDITEHLVNGDNEIAIAVEWTPQLYPSIKVYRHVINGSWNVKLYTKGLEEGWYREHYNDANWREAKLPIVFDKSLGRVVWLRGRFSYEPREDIAAPLKLVINANGVRAAIYVNGQFIGRFVDEGPQKEFYIPETILRRGENTVAIMLHIISDKASVNSIAIETYKQTLIQSLRLS
ncbi:MAG: beta-galactosidase [Ignisphaera sp.]|nr:beta-galactosidase [Ignisphaera sp.]